jgi:hypothetical protein
VLDLGHQPLVGAVGEVGGLGDDAVQPGALELLEPALRGLRVLGDRRDVHRLGDGDDLLQPGPPLRERGLQQRLVADREQVEGDEGRRRLLGQQVDPRLRRVDALQQRLEVQPVAVGDDDLAVDHAPRGQRRLHRLDHLGEVAGQRALVAAAQLHLVAVPEDDAPEAVPLRLVVHVLGRGHLRHGLGQHRLHRRQQGQVHAGQSSSRRRRPERAGHGRHRFGA